MIVIANSTLFFQLGRWWHVQASGLVCVEEVYRRRREINHSNGMPDWVLQLESPDGGIRCCESGKNELVDGWSRSSRTCYLPPLPCAQEWPIGSCKMASSLLSIVAKLSLLLQWLKDPRLAPRAQGMTTWSTIECSPFYDHILRKGGDEVSVM